MISLLISAKYWNVIFCFSLQHTFSIYGSSELVINNGEFSKIIVWIHSWIEREKKYILLCITYNLSNCSCLPFFKSFWSALPKAGAISRKEGKLIKLSGGRKVVHLKILCSSGMNCFTWFNLKYSIFSSNFWLISVIGNIFFF